METLEILRLGHRGDGIAEGPVYVPRTLPGEIVRGTVSNGVMADARIETPSIRRVRAPCRHARACGGCQLQHAADPFVADWKAGVVRRALDAQGLAAPFRPVLTSPPQSRRRAGFSARRLKRGALAGFHAAGSDTIVAVPDCRVVTPSLRAALPAVEALAQLGASRKAALTAHVTESLSGLDIAVSGLAPPSGSDLAALARRFDLARLSWGDHSLTQRPPGHRFGPALVVPPPGAFLQATKAGEAALQEAVAEAVGDARRIVDLFAGCGTFALPMASRAEIHAVEGDAGMIAALDRGWREAPGLRRVTHAVRDLFRNPLLPDELAGFDAAVIDPPRAGAEAQTEALAQARPKRIACVSCNPVTFARDAARLCAAGYALRWVQVVDQFRWSAHVELVAALTLEG